LAWKEYAQGLDALSGEEAQTQSNAPLYASMFSELAKGAGGLLQEQQAKDEAAKKSAADKEANKEGDAAVKAAQEARKKATFAAVDARAAKTKADATEKDPKGTLHKDAQRKADLATMLDADARAAEERAAFYRPGFGQPAIVPGAQVQQMPQGGISTKQILVGGGIVLGVGGLAALIYKLATRRPS
jgi:hypothetical protein